MPPSPPPFLKQQTVASLQKLCSSCGLPRTGSKAVLYQHIQRGARSLQPVPPTARILSIDLGIKNFAFSLLTPFPSPLSPSSSHPLASTPEDVSPPVSPARLHAWHRLDLTLGVPLPFFPSLLVPPEEQAAAAAAGFSDFSPASMSALTYDLVRDHLLPLQPTHVLIERQRFRSGSGAAIQEWTIRVNTLEAMLYAVFRTLAGCGQWSGQLFSVSPQAIARYLFPDGGAPSEKEEPPALDDEGEDLNIEELLAENEAAEKGELKATVRKSRAVKKMVVKKANPYAVLKQNKVSMLGEWLAPGRMMKASEPLVLPETEQALDMAGMFVEGWQAKENKVRKKKGVKKELLCKLDDLSDSVLQGLVWLQWQRNLEGLVQERPEVLEEAGEAEMQEDEVKVVKRKRKGKGKGEEAVLVQSAGEVLE